jgi:hypothetical protein
MTACRPIIAVSLALSFAPALIRLLGPAAFGLLVSVAYGIGANLLPFQAQASVGALSTFALSALGAWLGPAIAKWRAC